MREKLVETPGEKTRDRDEGRLMTTESLLLGYNDGSSTHTCYSTGGGEGRERDRERGEEEEEGENGEKWSQYWFRRQQQAKFANRSQYTLRRARG